jgi:Subtilase family
MKSAILLSIFYSLFCMIPVKASLHPEMGPPHVLDPDGVVMDERWNPYYASWSDYDLFIPSQDYKDLQAIFNKIKKELSQKPDAKRRQFLEKTLSVTEQGLTHLYLRDRSQHAQKNKKTERYAAPHSKKKSMRPFNTALDKSGALLWAQRHGILGQGVDVWVLEDYGTLEKEGIAIPKLSAVIKSTEPPLMRTYSYDVVESLAHGAEVAGVLHQIAPRATIHLIGDNLFSKVFQKTHSYYDPKLNPFPSTDLILNWSGAKGSDSTPIDYQIGHIRGFFETRSQFGDLLVKAIPNSQGGRGGSETDPAFMAHVLERYASHIILAGNLGPYRVATSPFSRDDALQALAEQRFLCAWGTDVLVPFAPIDPIAVKSGTSIAAPTIAGAAALVKSKYPHLSCAEAGQILLESAQKTFWLNTYDRVFVYDPEDFEEESVDDLTQAFSTLFGEALGRPSQKRSIPPKVNPKPFNPAIYGRGLLNLRRAFVYAEVKEKNPGLTPQQLKPLFKAAVQAQEDQAARTLQRAFRAYRLKRK